MYDSKITIYCPVLVAPLVLPVRTLVLERIGDSCRLMDVYCSIASSDRCSNTNVVGTENRGGCNLSLHLLCREGRGPASPAFMVVLRPDNGKLMLRALKRVTLGIELDAETSE